MIKLIERIKLDGKVQEFHQALREQTEILIANINGNIDSYNKFFNNEFINVDDIKKEIANTINVKLQIPIPERYIEEIIVANAEIEKKKRAPRRKK